MVSTLKKIAKSTLHLLLSPAFTKKCPVCNKKVKQFDPLPDYYSQNAEKYKFPYSIDEAETINYKEYLCPSCGAADRDRLYALYIDENTARDKSYKLLDIAPAKSLRNFLKGKKNINYRCADLLEKDVDDTDVDIMDMKNYVDNSFDIFICSHVLEHVEDDRKAIRELHRVLKKDGFGIAMVPIIVSIQNIDEDPALTDIGERWRRFGQEDHVRLYSKEGYKQRLIEGGFAVREVTIKDFNANVFFEYGISPKSVLYVVSK